MSFISHVRVESKDFPRLGGCKGAKRGKNKTINGGIILKHKRHKVIREKHQDMVRSDFAIGSESAEK
jgi:hypothetical protein